MTSRTAGADTPVNVEEERVIRVEERRPAKAEEERLAKVEETGGTAETVETAQSSDNEQPNIDAVGYPTFFKNIRLISSQESEYDGESSAAPEGFE